jgi:glycosyltransferase involved in cell wall biosynthesis
MKILIINSRYFISAGPEKYMFKLKEILEKNNHEVVAFSTKNSHNAESEYSEFFVDPIGGADKVYFSEYKNDFKTLFQIVGRQFYSFEVKKNLDELIKKTKPDIAYLLHHYNKLSPSVIDACKKNNVPVVMRLSDFSLVCPEGHMYRDKKPCEECIDKSLFSAVKHKCVKNSRVGSAIKASAIKFHRVLGIYDEVKFIVSPSKFTISKVKTVLDEDKMIHIPTFVIKTEKYNSKLGKYILFVGRLEEIKGVMQIIRAVKGTDYIFKIVGESSSSYDTYLKNYVGKANIKNVKFLGKKNSEELVKLYKDARFVVIPSMWYENLPNVALEAMMHSKPLLVSNLGSMKDIVREGHNGFLFEPDNIPQIKEKIDLLFDDFVCKTLGKNSYDEVISKYNPEKHYDKLIRVFNKVVNGVKK